MSNFITIHGEIINTDNIDFIENWNYQLNYATLAIYFNGKNITIIQINYIRYVYNNTNDFKEILEFERNKIKEKLLNGFINTNMFLEPKEIQERLDELQNR